MVSDLGLDLSDLEGLRALEELLEEGEKTQVRAPSQT